MVRIGFVHSHKFQICGEKVYSNGHFPYRIWNRYLAHFDKIRVIARSETCLPADISALDVASGPNVDFVRLPHLNRISRYWREYRKARTILEESVASIDGAIIRLSRIGWLAAAECERQKKPWAVEVVGDPWDALWNYGTWQAKMYAPIAFLDARKWIKKAGFAVYVTQKHLQRRYPCHGITGAISDVEISCSNDTVLNLRLQRYSDIGREKNRTWKVGLIGSLNHHYKGLHVALKALKRLREKQFKVHLHVLGRGKNEYWRNEAQKLGVTDLVHLDGTLPSGEPVLHWLDELDFYIQPSFQEGLPRALIEAMSRGLPALGSRCGGIPELLPFECLHKPGNDHKLAADIVRLIDDQQWTIHHITRNFAEAQKYDKDVVGRQRHDFFNQFSEHVRNACR